MTTNGVSPWVTLRLYRRLIRPLHLRAYHVLDEGRLIEITDIQKPKSVRYVIQEHRTDRQKGRAHWDLRIHHQKTGLSWAVPKHAKPMVGRPFLAVRQPDHHPDYSDFEGTIEPGQKGAGTVTKAGEGMVDILKIETGKLGFKTMHLRFHGDLEGDFVLIETGGPKGNDWLWIAKHQPSALTPFSKHAFTVRQRAELAEIERKCGGNCIAEVKVDGHHDIMYVTPHGVRLASHRLGKYTGVPIEHSDKLPHLRDIDPKTLGKGGGSVFHVELYIKGQSAAITGGVLNSKTLKARAAQQKLGLVQVKVLDVAQLRGESVKPLPYGERRRVAIEAIGELGSSDVHYVRGTQRSFDSFYGRVVTGREFRYTRVPNDGIVLKDLNRPYQQPRGPWIKVKPHDPKDLVVVGFTEEMSAAGELKGRLGALTVLTPTGKQIQVGTGFKHAQKDWIWKNRDEIVGDVAQVRFHSRLGSPWTGPRFEGFHPGKSERGALMALELAEV